MSKISIIGPAHPFRGGIAAYNERLSKALQQNGDEVNIHTFTIQYPQFLFPGKSQYSDEQPPKDLNIVRDVNSVFPLNWWRTGNKIRNEKPDIAIFRFWLPFMGPALGTIARRIRKNNHTKILAIVDNIIPHEKRPGDNMLTKYFVNSIDGFIVMSRSVMDDLQKFDTKKPRIFCPHPVYDQFGAPVEKNEAKRRLGLDIETNYLLFFGFIRDYKGLDLLLKAIADERFANKPLKLIVAGEYYTDPKPYEKLIRDLNIEERVNLFTEFIPDSKVAEYFCASDMVVQPYKNATQSGVTQIAYHFNKPMIVTDVGGLAELIPHGKVGYVVEKDPRAISDAILKFYTDKKQDEFVDHVIKEKEKFSWEALVQKIYELAAKVG